MSDRNPLYGETWADIQARSSNVPNKLPWEAEQSFQQLLLPVMGKDWVPSAKLRAIALWIQSGVSLPAAVLSLSSIAFRATDQIELKIAIVAVFVIPMLIFTVLVFWASHRDKASRVFFYLYLFLATVGVHLVIPHLVNIEFLDLLIVLIIVGIGLPMLIIGAQRPKEKPKKKPDEPRPEPYA